MSTPPPSVQMLISNRVSVVCLNVWTIIVNPVVYSIRIWIVCAEFFSREKNMIHVIKSFMQVSFLKILASTNQCFSILVCHWRTGYTRHWKWNYFWKVQFSNFWWRVHHSWNAAWIDRGRWYKWWYKAGNSLLYRTDQG